MAEKLIIVESPAKVHTIKKFLGSGYEVIASQGHVRDLPKSRLGVKVEEDFEPEYITIRGKGEIMNRLKKAVKKADKIYLATDPDREGEAISWHLANALKLDGRKVYRITFNEITKNAVKEALKNPSVIDENLVNAQQARRVMDRVVGYKLSPILWKKIRGKLSAGRVQSAVLKMICDREKEIQEFVPEEYYTVEGEFIKDNEKKAFTAEYYGENRKKYQPVNENDVKRIKAELDKGEFIVSDVKTGNRIKTPPLPFTTSTLQQEASSKLNFSASKTMREAQKLYEGVKTAAFGTIGLITYLRTDSTRISDEADRLCKEYIKINYGENHVGTGAVKNKDNAQDAHEAIRPTDVLIRPEDVKNDLSRDEFRLYQLIYKRFVASRMKAAVYDTLSVHIDNGNQTFVSALSELSFPGFLNVYGSDEEKKTGDRTIRNLSKGDRLTMTGFNPMQHFTTPLPHFTEASLVRAMEENGLGRPSTYAPTISNIQGKHYITKEGKNIFVTELGEAVNGLLLKSFPDIVDIGFTAQMETELDSVAEGNEDWHKIMRGFYPAFEKEVETAEKEFEKIKVEDEVSDVACDKCGRMMVIKYGPHGKFLACPGFPECKNTLQYREKAGVKCPKCGSEVLILRSKSGRRFFGCENQECDFMSWVKPKV